MEWWADLFRETIAHYPGDLDAGMHACEQLLSIPGLPEEIETWTRRNQTWYARNLAPQGTVTTIDIPHREGWSLFNPSIAVGEEGRLKMTVRSSNYHIDSAGRYVIPPEDEGIIKSENYLLNLGDDLDARQVLLLNDEGVVNHEHPYPVQGLEDLRLFCADGWENWKVLATVRDRTPSGTCTQMIADITAGNVLANPQQISQGHTHDKNWMPVPRDSSGVMKYLTSCHPVMVASAYGWGHFAWAPAIARSFRGGSQAIPIKGGRLAVVHEPVTMEPYKRIYLHRFVTFCPDKDWRIAKVSDPFVFEDWGIEFCAGMAKVGEDLVLSYGVRDAEAHLLRLPQKTVMAMLRDPLPEEL